MGNLEKKDIIGKSDPYAKIQYGTQISRTKTIKNNLNPTWDHQMKIQVYEKSASTIDVEFYDEDFGKDTPLGKASIDVAEIISQGNISRQCLKLKDCKSGDIEYTTKCIPIDAKKRLVTSVSSESDPTKPKSMSSYEIQSDLESNATKIKESGEHNIIEGTK